MTPVSLFGLFPNLQSGQFGGVEASGRLAWQALDETIKARGERATLFCYAKGAARPSKGEWIHAQSKAEAIWKLLRVRVKPRVILVWHLGLLKLVPLLRAPHARVVLFLHGIEAWRAQDALTQRVLSRVNLLLANSTFTYLRFLDFVPAARTISHSITPLGIDVPRLNPFLPSVEPIFLMLSRLDRGEDYKGHRELIGAWRLVREQIPNARLWIAGDGNLRPDLERRVQELHLGEAVRFLGQVSEARKAELLQECHALAMPSRGEGFGLVYLEAMRMARPCLVSDCDAGREVVNPPEAGLAVNPADSRALADAACRLLASNDEWLNWSRRAQRRYESNFTAAHFQARLVAALDPLLVAKA